MKRERIILLFFILCPLLGGCWDAVEPERMSYIHGLGVDYKNGEYVVYVQLINIASLAKSESGGTTSKQKVEIGHSAGKDIDEAMFKLYNSTQIRLFWGHLKFLVLSKSALENQGLDKVLDLMDRYRETRYRMYMYSTEEDIKQVLSAYQPVQITSALNKLAEPTNSFKQNSFILPVKMREFLITLQQPGNSGFLPKVSLTKGDTWEEDHKKLPSIQLDGLSLVTKQSLIGSLTGSDVAGYRWMTVKSKRNGLSIEKDDKVVAKLIIEKNKVKIKPSMNGDTVHFTINVKASGIINELDQNVDEVSIRDSAAAKIKEEILHTYAKAVTMNADIYQLNEVLHKKNNKLWKKLSKNGILPLHEDSVSVNVSVFIKDAGKLRTTK